MSDAVTYNSKDAINSVLRHDHKVTPGSDGKGLLCTCGLPARLDFMDAEGGAGRFMVISCPGNGLLQVSFYPAVAGVGETA